VEEEAYLDGAAVGARRGVREELAGAGGAWEWARARGGPGEEASTAQRGRRVTCSHARNSSLNRVSVQLWI